MHVQTVVSVVFVGRGDHCQTEGNGAPAGFNGILVYFHKILILLDVVVKQFMMMYLETGEEKLSSSGYFTHLVPPGGLCG